jgi:hypothetical protein
MNVKKNGEFSKFSISVEFETPEEAAAFYSLFNHSDIRRATVGDANADKVKAAIVSGFGGLPPYQTFHSELCKIF